LPEFIWKWRKEIIFSLLVLISLGLLVSQRKPDMISQGFRQGLIFAIVPMQKLSMSASRNVRDFIAVLASLGRLRKENAELHKEVNQLTLTNVQLAELARENAALREELGYRRSTPWQFIPAEIVGRDPASWLERVIVNRGTADGVRRGAGVITPQGVAGRVSDVMLYAATVMLLPDAQSSVSGSDDRSRVPGSVKGTGKRWLSLVHVSGTDDIKVGDTILTSNASSLFPPGLAIGDVISVVPADTGLMLSIQVKPRVNFSTLDRVLILKTEE
jgi:rod shape-determining protein MreC